MTVLEKIWAVKAVKWRIEASGSILVIQAIVRRRARYIVPLRVPMDKLCRAYGALSVSERLPRIE